MDQILIGVPVTLLDADITTGPGTSFALPARYCVWAVQLSIAPTHNFTLDIECSIDGIVWGAVASYSQADLTSDELVVISDVIIGKFVRGNILTNGLATAITLIINGQVGESKIPVLSMAQSSAEWDAGSSILTITLRDSNGKIPNSHYFPVPWFAEADDANSVPAVQYIVYPQTFSFISMMRYGTNRWKITYASRVGGMDLQFLDITGAPTVPAFFYETAYTTEVFDAGTGAFTGCWVFASDGQRLEVMTPITPAGP